MESRLNRIYQMVLLTVCLSYLGAAAVYVLNGLAMRLSGDDYCYNAVLIQYGFLQAQVQSYTNLSLYNGNRYALTLASGLAGNLAPSANGFLPGLALLLWVVGLAACLRWMGLIASFVISHQEAFFIAGFWILMTLALLPNLPQSLYWRSAMLTYLAPLVCLILLAAFILRRAHLSHTQWWVLPFIFCVAVLCGGFSEVGAALQTTCFALGLLISWVLLRRDSRFKRIQLAQLSRLLATGFLGSLFAMFFLYISPFNAIVSQNYPERASIALLIRLVSFNTTFFLLANLYSHVVPILLTLVGAGFFSLVWLDLHSNIHFRIHEVVFWMPITLLSGILLIAACMAPTSFIQHSYPEQRALVLPDFILVGMVLTLGGLSGAWTRYLLDRWLVGRKRLQVLFLVLAAGCALYPLLAARQERLEHHRYQRWVRFWDTRDAGIREARALGLNDLDVVQIDHIIPDVAELSPDPDYWYNNCAEIMYGVQSISANQPGWDE